MSSSELVSIDALKDVKFKDVAALDRDFRNLLDFDSYTDGKPVIVFSKGQLLIRCGESDELSEFAETYGCWGEAGSRLLAKHLAEGKILVRLQPEGWPDELHMITPGKAQKVNVEKLLGF
ncbi:hypothetical protein G6L37_05555 [Agrobacterium rubi]|nr:hypothetical protein [Agrobacterium rubi]NTF24824.1 hypothetical protein [Agrobacterium rubi]